MKTTPLTKTCAAKMNFTYHIKKRDGEAREVTLEEYVNHVGVENPLPRYFMQGDMIAWIDGPDAEKFL